jgi:hypothetical protein
MIGGTGAMMGGTGAMMGGTGAMIGGTGLSSALSESSTTQLYASSSLLLKH